MLELYIDSDTSCAILVSEAHNTFKIPAKTKKKELYIVHIQIQFLSKPTANISVASKTYITDIN